MKTLRVSGAWSRRGIQTRVVALVTLGMLSSLAVLGGASWAGLAALNRQLLAERELLARSLADHLEHSLQQSLELLQGIASAGRLDLDDTDPAPEHEALKTAYLDARHALPLDAVFLVSSDGRVASEAPFRNRRPIDDFRNLPSARQAFGSGKPIVSDLVPTPVGPRVYVFVPLRNLHGAIVGLVAGELDPAALAVWSPVQAFGLGATGSADVVDSRGTVIASTDASRRFTEGDHREFLAALIKERRPAVGACHSCHDQRVVGDRAREVIAFTPLATAPWGVSVRQRESEAMAALIGLRRHVLWLAPLVIGVTVLFGWGAARSVRKPVMALTSAAERIASGAMSDPIPRWGWGEDEVGRLARALEEMRVALKASIEDVARANQELEARVEARTRELARLYAELQEREAGRVRLLRRVISAQEDERKRLARELHDETCQTLSALAMGLETALGTFPSSASRARLTDARTLALRALDELHRLMFDLRPSVLDDLGLPAAIRWFAERHLLPLGVAVRCEFSGLDRRLPPALETALFRVVQEAVTNIARHAGAETVLVQGATEDDRLLIEIEDDGKGFSPAEVAHPRESGQGLGLLGMRERVELVGGRLTIDSTPGRGTRVALEVPLSVAAAV